MRTHFQPYRRWRTILITIFLLYYTFIGGGFVANVVFWLRLANHIIMTILLGWWLIARLLKREEFPSAGPLDTPLVSWLGVMVFTTIFSADPRLSLEATWRGLTFTLLFYFILDVMRHNGARAILEPLFFTAGVVTLLIIGEFVSWYFGLPFLGLFEQGWPSIGGWQQPIPPLIYRAGFAFGYTTATSAYLAMLIPLGLSWALTTQTLDKRRALCLWLVGLIIAEGLTFSRGGILSLAVSLPLLGLFTWHEGIGRLLRDRRTWIALGIAIVILTISAIGWTRQNLGGHASGDASRLDLWRSTLVIAQSDPLTGVGPDGFGRALRLVRNPMTVPDRMFVAHNRLLTVLAETGIIGAGILIWGAAAMTIAAIQQMRTSTGTERIRTAGATAAVIGFAAHNMVDEFVILSVLIPLMAIAAYILKPKENDPPRQWQRLATMIALGLLATSAIGWAISDLAEYRFVQSLQRNDNEALGEISYALRIDPEMELYAFQHAQYLGEIGLSDSSRLEEALAAYEEALQLEETSDVAHANYAYLLYQSNDLEAAREHMLRAIEIAPRNPAYALWAGVLAEHNDLPDEAIRHYAQALASRPTWAASEFWDEQNITLLDEAFTEALSVIPLHEQGQLHFYAGNGEEGIALATQAVEEENTDLAWLTLGELHLRSGAYTEAEAVLTESIQRNSANTQAYALRAEARLNLGDLAGADRDARIAIFLASTEHSAAANSWYVLGRLAEQNDDTETACIYYRRSFPFEIHSLSWERSTYRRTGSFPLLLDLPNPTEYETVALDRFQNICED